MLQGVLVPDLQLSMFLKIVVVAILVRQEVLPEIHLSAMMDSQDGDST